MVNRRQFCQAVGASSVLAGIPLTAMSSGLPSPFRAKPNPSRLHFDVATATEFVARHNASNFEDDSRLFSDIIDLEPCSTCSLEALAVLTEREWFSIEFGISELTVEVATALRNISCGVACFTHIEYAHPEALAILLTETKLQNIHFENLVSIDPSGMNHLNGCLSGAKTECTVSLWGLFAVIDAEVSQALLSFPLDYLSLQTDKSLKFVTPEALSMLKQAETKRVTIQSGAVADIQIWARAQEREELDDDFASSIL